MKSILCIIFLCLSCLTDNFAQQNTVAAQIQEAFNLLQNNQLDEAEKILQKLQLTASDNVDVHNLLGIVFDQKGQPAEAEKQFRQAMRINPKAVSPLANLGVLLAKTSRQTEAIQIFETIIRLAPNHPEAIINLGFLYNAAGNFPKAIVYLKKANELQPNTYDIVLNLGTALYNAKSYDEAAQNFETAANLSSDSAEPFYRLGMIAFDRNQDELAKSYFERAVAMRPDYTEANFMLGELFAKYQNYPEAKNYYELVLKSDSTKPVYYIRLGGIYLFLKDFENSLKIFNEASSAFPNVSEIHYFYAATERAAGNFDSALTEVKKSLALKDTADSNALLGAILADNNNIIEAEKYLRKALLINPKHFNSLNDLGRLLVKNRRYEEAVPFLQRAAAVSSNPDVHYQLFLAYSRLNRKDEADRELQVFKQLSNEK